MVLVSASCGQVARTGGAPAMLVIDALVAAAGTVHYLTLEQIKSSIRELGWVPRQRNVLYELIDEAEPVVARAPSAR